MKMQKKVNAAILIFDIVMGLLLLFVFANKQGMTVGVMSGYVANAGIIHKDIVEGQMVSAENAEQKKIALTFDDDVIIGLSQEISYKEAVSMI